MQMSRGHWLRIAVIFILIAIAFFFIKTHVANGQAFAQDIAGEVALGRNLADAWCMECHAVDRQRRTARLGPSAPDFVSIANRPATTELAIKTFLRSDHETMPNFIVEPRDADILAAYILSLRRR